MRGRPMLLTALHASDGLTIVNFHGREIRIRREELFR